MDFRKILILVVSLFAFTVIVFNNLSQIIKGGFNISILISFLLIFLGVTTYFIINPKLFRGLQ